MGSSTMLGGFAPRGKLHAMPELPEVEITRRGLAPPLTGQKVTGLIVRDPRLRYPVPGELGMTVTGRVLRHIRRRAKYLLFDFGDGALLVHLGMSGSLRLVPVARAPEKHDHVDLIFGEQALRLRDPRRFGALLWIPADVQEHPLLAHLGIEPLSAEFSGEWLYRGTRHRTTCIKQLLMDGRFVVGVGNIYASESLYRARVDPRTPAGRLSLARCERVTQAVKATLEAALAAGGSSLRDFVHSDGSSGYFQQQYFVYNRGGEACRVCRSTVRAVRQGQRSTFYCPRCQR